MKGYWANVVIPLLVGLAIFLGMTAHYYSELAGIYEHESKMYKQMLEECVDHLPARSADALFPVEVKP